MQPVLKNDRTQRLQNKKVLRTVHSVCGEFTDPLMQKEKTSLLFIAGIASATDIDISALLRLWQHFSESALSVYEQLVRLLFMFRHIALKPIVGH